MKIKILYYAQLRDIFGCDSREMEVRQDASVGEVEQMLRRQAGLEELFFKKAVNEEWASDERILKDQDVLVLLPPVSGG